MIQILPEQFENILPLAVRWAEAKEKVHLTRGLTVEKAWEVNPEKVAAYLETLPEDHFHCAELSVGGFYLALSDFQKHNFRKK